MSKSKLNSRLKAKSKTDSNSKHKSVPQTHQNKNQKKTRTKISIRIKSKSESRIKIKIRIKVGKLWISDLPRVSGDEVTAKMSIDIDQDIAITSPFPYIKIIAGTGRWHSQRPSPDTALFQDEL